MIDKILTGEDIVTVFGQLTSFAEWAKRIGFIGGWEFEDRIRVKAIINNGRWIVPCPFCYGAELLWEDKHLFICGSCKNRKVEYKVIEVELPLNRDEIEQILLKREPRNRNWSPTESKEKLQKENIAHGVI